MSGFSTKIPVRQIFSVIIRSSPAGNSTDQESEGLPFVILCNNNIWAHFLNQFDDSGC